MRKKIIPASMQRINITKKCFVRNSRNRKKTIETNMKKMNMTKTGFVKNVSNNIIKTLKIIQANIKQKNMTKIIHTVMTLMMTC